MLLLVDVMNYDSVVSLNELSIPDAFIDLSMALEDLENGFFIDVILMLAQEGSELFHLVLSVFLELVLLSLRQSIALPVGKNVIDFIQLQLDDPRAEQVLLRFDLLLVFLLHDDLQHFRQIIDKAGVEVLLHEPQSDLLEAL